MIIFYQVSQWSSFYTETTDEWSEPSPKRITMKPPPPITHEQLMNQQRHLSKSELAKYGGLKNYNKKVNQVRDRLKAQAYKVRNKCAVQFQSIIQGISGSLCKDYTFQQDSR